MADCDLTLGVEEEFLLVDATTRAPLAMADQVVGDVPDTVRGIVDRELQRSQMETGTRVCSSLQEIRADLVDLRAALAEAAGRRGGRVVAMATHPFAHWSDESVSITPTASYLALERDYAQLAREQLVGGCHVHVGIRDREEGIRVMNGARIWMPVMVAMSGNSPFWLSTDTGYASYRTQIFHRWPTAGSPEYFNSRAEYDEVVRLLLATGTIDAPARIYWDVRPSARYETIEFRATDVCATVDEAVMVAGILRGLTATYRSDETPPIPRPEILRSALWRAARYGITATLVDVLGGTQPSAREVVDGMLATIRPALEDIGDWDEVHALVDQLFGRGTGATRQRRAWERRERFEDVIDAMAAETLS